MMGQQNLSDPRHAQPPVSEMVISAFGLIFGPPVFLFGQILFIINPTKAIIKMIRRRTGLSRQS